MTQALRVNPFNLIVLMKLKRLFFFSVFIQSCPFVLLSSTWDFSMAKLWRKLRTHAAFCKTHSNSVSNSYSKRTFRWADWNCTEMQCIYAQRVMHSMNWLHASSLVLNLLFFIISSNWIFCFQLIYHFNWILFQWTNETLIFAVVSSSFFRSPVQCWSKLLNGKYSCQLTFSRKFQKGNFTLCSKLQNSFWQCISRKLEIHFASLIFDSEKAIQKIIIEIPFLKAWKWVRGSCAMLQF